MQPLPIHNIAICFPSTDDVKTSFAYSLADLAHQTQHRLAFVNTRSAYIDDNRNRGIEQVLQANREMGCEITHILFLDTDIVFPPSILDTLLSRDKEIVGAAYPKKVFPHPLIYTPIKGKIYSEADQVWEVEAIPAGCLLVKLTAFEKMRKPWFANTYVHTHRDRAPFEHLVSPSTPTPFLVSEDYYFCAVAKLRKIQIFLDIVATHMISHEGTKGFTPADVVHQEEIAGSSAA